ncbi:glutamyl-tRNA(Gln) amidotransferase subunit A, mitochondrial isoform X2 [Cephus cinctus]|nr:glutamyl-tRNA(Gln) amidotransferase subunit A, mitochondrial isoform X2 [Cephus cinctus]
MLANFIPEYDATVYNRLKNAGAILIGKTNLDQFAMGSGTVDSYYGPTKNLWNSDILNYYVYDFHKETSLNMSPLRKDDWYIAGGSSGGSAIAVATRTCYAAIGSDTGGSTRNPASYCGLIGLKPTYGLVSRHGLIPLVNSMDVPGIITRNVDDVLLILNAIAGPDSFDSTTLQRDYMQFQLPESVDITGLRIGIPTEYRVPGLSEEVESCWDKVACHLKEAGATVIPVSLPHTKYSIVCYSILNQCEVASNMARYDGIEYGLRADENYSTEALYAKSRSEGFNDVVRSRILAGNYFLLQENYDDYFVKAMKMRRLISNDFNAVWDSNVDILLTPTTLSDAPLYSEYTSSDNQTQCSIQDFCTQPANMAGIPAINVPTTISRKGLPISLQLMAPFLHEQRLLTIAKWIEQAVQFPQLTLKDTYLLK